MILSAVSLWKKFNLKTNLGASEWGIETRHGFCFSHVSYSGHETPEGSVRIYAQFGRPEGDGKKPTVLLLPDAGNPVDREIMQYFMDKGYAVLMPDYSGKMEQDGEGVMRTVYPSSLAHGNYEKARGLTDLKNISAEESTWFEWVYVALFSVKYLKSRPDVGNIGVVGIRKGGEIAWQTMLSPDVKCGVPINAVGWRSSLNMAKFGDNVAHNLSDDRHRYIAALEAQSYAPYVKCPVLMLCALRDIEIDCDRAYDTYSRIGNQDGNALVYSPNSGACIGPNALVDMDLFLEKNLKGREIYIPDTLNVSVKEDAGGLVVEVECDPEGILEEAGIYYAEGDVKTKSNYREWRCVHMIDGKSVKNGKVNYRIKPFEGATAVFIYAYAKYINGFRVMSKITSKRLSSPKANAVKSRKLFSGDDMDCFGIADYKSTAVGGIFVEREYVPKVATGYGDIRGAYSISGIKTYKISSPRYVPDENALLEFDAYCKQTETIIVTVDMADVEKDRERYSCELEVKGGGKWKRIILKSTDFKGETYGMPLANFSDGRALSFKSADENAEFAITNILWL